MRSWTRPGAFTIDIPDDWSVTEEDGTVEIEPPTRTSACHVSTYRRLKSGPPTPAEAEELTRRFAAAQGLHDLMVEVHQFPLYVDASASFAQPHDRDVIQWELRTRLSTDRLILWSFDHLGAGDQDRPQALAIWTSLRPDDRSRMTRWRRALGVKPTGGS